MRFIPPTPQFKKPSLNTELPQTTTPNPRVGKYTEKYRKLEKQKAQEMAKKIADEKKKKKMDFLLDLVKALIIAVATLAIEHFMDIIRFFQNLLSGFSQG